MLKKTYKKVSSKQARLDEELEMINRLGLSTEQKNALFKAAGEAMVKMDSSKFLEIMQVCCPETIVDGTAPDIAKKVVAEASVDTMRDILTAMSEASEDADDKAYLDEMVEVLTEKNDDDEDEDKESDEDADDDKDADEDEDSDEDKDDKKSMEESLKVIFGSDLLTEETQTKITALFEAAVSERVDAKVALISEELEAQMSEQIATLVDRVDAFLNEAVETFMEENKLAVEQGIRVEMAESFMAGIKTLAEEHNFAIAETDVDAVAELTTEVEQLKAKLDESLSEKAALKSQLDAGDISAAIAEAGKNLTVVQQEKLVKLAEGLEFTTKEKYAAKLEVIVEQYFSAPAGDASPVVSGVLTEEKEIDVNVSQYVAAISRTSKK